MGRNPRTTSDQKGTSSLGGVLKTCQLEGHGEKAAKLWSSALPLQSQHKPKDSGAWAAARKASACSKGCPWGCSYPETRWTPASDASAELLMAKRYAKVSLNHCFCTWIGVPACKHNQTHSENAKRKGMQASIEEIGEVGMQGVVLFLPNRCALLHPERRFARTWVSVRDEHPGRHVARRVGAELLCKDAEGAAGEGLGDAERGGQADEPRAHHRHLGCCHLRGAEPHLQGKEQGTSTCKAPKPRTRKRQSR